ncbi:MAG: hypothetical protein QXW70_02310 [Candidatus Anstonellales archaeon]
MVKKIIDCPPGKEFIFRLPDGTAIGKAKNIIQFAELVKIAPLPCLLFHAKGRHFSPWLELIGEKDAANRLNSIEINESTVRVSILRALK